MKIWKQKSFGMSTNRWSRISDFPKRRCLITTVLIWRETIQMLRRSHLKVSVKDASKVASSWLIYVTSTKPGNWSHFLNKTISGGRNCDVLKRKNRIFLVRDYQTNIVRHHAMKKDVLDVQKLCLLALNKLHLLWMFDKCLLSQKLHSTRKSIRHIDCRFAILPLVSYFSLIFTKLTHVGSCHQFKWICEFPVWKFALICHWQSYWLAEASVEHLTSSIVFQCTFYTKAKLCYIKMCKDINH